MALKTLPPFNPVGKFEAGKPFRFNGEDYEPGDEFDPIEVGCKPRLLELLYNQKKVAPIGSYEERVRIAEENAARREAEEAKLAEAVDEIITEPVEEVVEKPKKKKKSDNKITIPAKETDG